VYLLRWDNGEKLNVTAVYGCRLVATVLSNITH